MKWEETEYRECSEDWRNRDRLIWATLPVLITVISVTIGIAYGEIFSSKLWIRLLLLTIGLAFAYVMLISLIRHRLYQEGSEKLLIYLRSRLYMDSNYPVNPRIYPSDDFKLKDITFKTLDERFTKWILNRSGFKNMVRTTLFALLFLIILILHTLYQLIFN